MIDIKNKQECCGCQACFNICPKNAIEMIEDDEGFKYPKINKEKCIKCGLCEKVCPYVNEYSKKQILNDSIAYGGWNLNEEIRRISSSGGIFTAIAKHIIEKKGVVCGAIFDENLNVVHDIIDNLNDLKKMNGAKYVQSDMRDNLKKIKKYLENGKLVLFSGTPCQVSGLNSYLNKEYNNLYTCDIVCHGVPSPKVFNKYKKELEEKSSSKLSFINFRDKLTGWKSYSFSARFKNNKTFIEKANQNSYMRIFLNDIDLRQSCPTCKFAKLPRYTDFTLGDFWGVDENYIELDKDNKGTSLILVHTDKGKKLLEENKDIFIKECDLEKAIKGNPSILKHNKASKNRDKFFKNIDKYNLDILSKKYLKKKNVFQRIIKKLKKLLEVD